MDAFGDNFDDQAADPAADFLAREQQGLAGLEDDLAPAAAVTQPPKVEDFSASESHGSFEMINNVEPQEFPTDVAEPISDDRNNDNFDYSYEPVPRPLHEEPEKIKKWREEQQTRLEQKDVEEEKKREELREQAKKELEDWYKHHEDAISKTKSSNRNAEKQFVAETDEIEPGTEWERIAKVCDFNPKSTKSTRDVSRMRSIILQLKQNPLATSKKI